MIRPACGIVLNQGLFRHSSRALPLRDWIYAFSLGSGWIKRRLTGVSQAPAIQQLALKLRAIVHGDRVRSPRASVKRCIAYLTHVPVSAISPWLPSIHG